MGLLATASVAIDGSKFKAVNNRDKNFTRAKVERRHTRLEESVARYLSQLDTANQQPHGGAGREGNKAYREADEAEGGDGQACRLREADARFARSANLANRPNSRSDGDKRPRFRRRRLQRPSSTPSTI